VKNFAKLGLVAAILTSGSAFAMQAMDESAMSNTTGQDGITVLVALPSNTLNIDQIAVFDKNGLATANPTTTNGNEAGAILLGKVAPSGSAAGTAPSVGNGFSIATNGTIGLAIDASGGGNSTATTGAAPVLNIAVSLPTTFTLNTGDISVAGAQGAAGAQKVDGNTSPSKIMNTMAVGLGGLSVNIQLGNPLQGAMIVASGTITGGITIGNLNVVDNTTANAGTLNVTNFQLLSNGSTNLALNATVDVANTAGLTAAGIKTPTGAAVTSGGLVIGLGTLASGNYATGTYTAGSAKYDMYMTGVTLGDAASTLGDVKITGMDLTGAKVIVQGH